MRIAVVNQPWSRFRPPVDRADSISIWVYQVARRLWTGGGWPTLFLMRGHPGQAGSETQEGITYRRWPYWPKYRWYQPLQRLLDAVGWTGLPFSHPGYERTYAAWAAHEAAAEGAEVIHVHNFAQFLPVLREANPKARLVLHMHCEWLSQLPARRVGNWVGFADALWGCSEHITGKIRARFPALAHRCQTIPNGVDGAQFARTRAPLRGQQILFVGRLSPEKGLHVLIEAFARLAPARPNATLRLVGPAAPTPPAFLIDLDSDPRVKALRRFYPGDYLQQLQALVPASLRHRVQFTPELPPRKLPAVYAGAAVLANPSLSEAFGMSLVEAMASGVPVVAARTGGMPEIVEDGVTGRLVAADDPSALADALAEALEPSAELRARTTLARQRALARFDWAKVAGRVEAAYENLVHP